MKKRHSLCLVASLALFGSAGLARAAASDTAGAADALSATADASSETSVPAIPTGPAIVAAVRPVMAEVFRPAPMPGEDARAPTAREVADAGPNLHPDVLGVHEKSDGALGNTDLAYNRNERMKPAGGMSLNIPMQ